MGLPDYSGYDELGNRIAPLPNGRKRTTQRFGSGHWIGTLWNGSPIADIERNDLHREKIRLMGRITPQRKDRLTQTRHYDPNIKDAEDIQV